MIYLSQTTLLKVVNFPSQIPDPRSFSTVAFLSLESSGHFVVSVYIDFTLNSKGGCPPFHYIVLYYCHVHWNSLYGHLRDVPWEDEYL